MWEYSSPMDPDRASPKELSKDEVQSYLGRALQLRDEEMGRPDPFMPQSYPIWYAFSHDLFLLVLMF